MERIWAPWRSQYVRNSGHEEGCFLCEARETSADREHLVLGRSRSTLAVMNRYPYAPGHVMLAPFRHTSNLGELDDSELLDLLHGVRTVQAALVDVFTPEGFNIGLNLGRAAGAGLEDHLHIHVVPRWSGDTNFMAVTVDVKVVSEALMESYDRLWEALKNGWEAL